MSLLWINGQLVDKADARVSPFDHGFLYGDGVWEHFRLFGGQLFRPAAGLKHLFDSAAAFDIDIPLSQDELRAAIEATVRANNRTEGYVRVIVTRGPGTIGPDPRKLVPQVIIIAEEYYPFPAELYDHGLHAGIAQNCYHPLRDRWKPLGPPYLVRAKQEALRQGCLEAVILWGTEVVGGTEGDLYLVNQGKITEVLRGGSLAIFGVISELAAAAGIEMEDVLFSQPATIEDLYTADEVFLAGVTCGLIAVIRMDNKPIGGGKEGPITRDLRERYRVLTRGAE
jgi:branched-chain amino acid aminotransferase